MHERDLLRFVLGGAIPSLRSDRKAPTRMTQAARAEHATAYMPGGARMITRKIIQIAFPQPQHGDDHAQRTGSAGARRR